VSCSDGGCHSEQATAARSSAHDRKNLAEVQGLPGCEDCHGGHELADAAAVACEKRLDRTCLPCHPEERYAVGSATTPRPAGLAESVHGVLRGTGRCSSATLTCYTCHGFHTVLASSDPVSPVSRARITDTCGQCHVEQRDAYADSAHGTALAGGSEWSPTCASCHGANDVLLAEDPSAPTSIREVVYTCAECHEDPAVARSAQLREDVVESYERTFHGVAYDNGVTDTATCASCHGAHEVRSSTDPASRTHESNLSATCTPCHETVDEQMVAQVSHPSEWKGLWATARELSLYFPVAGTALNPLLVSGMGALVGFLSGLFGVGGGFLMTPLLIFIGIPAAVAAATDAAQITAGASSGALSHSRIGNVDFKMGLTIVAGGWVGGFVGVQLVAVLRNLGNFDFFLKGTYVIVLGFIGSIGSAMFLEGVRTLRGKSPSGEPKAGRLSLLFRRLPFQVYFPKSGLTTSAILPVVAGFLVGILAAFLGVGGGFIMLPTMIYIIGIPTRVAVGTDLFQIVLTSANVTLQQAITNHTVDLLLAVTLFMGSTIGAQFGVMASRRLKGEQIRVFLAIIVLIVMGILLYQLLATPEFLIDFARSGGGH